MKTQHIIAASLAAIALMSCDNPMSFRTKVNADGSLEKTITFEKIDKDKAQKNIFGISEKNGWSLTKSRPLDSATTKSDKDKYRLQFKKRFGSDDAMNGELDKNTDTLFRVHAKFEKKFRWFYTYIRYSETILPINRFKKVSPKDFFTREDSLFIKRLPTEGKTISNADSVSLQLLNEKISDHYASMGIFNETYQIVEDAIKKNNLGKNWIDTLFKNRDFIYNMITKDQGNISAKKIADTLRIPIPKETAERDFAELSKDFDTRINFMSFARDGKYLNEFEMPWSVVSSNADSVAGNKLYWRPLVHKFIYMDYEMFAESRKMNLWAVIVSLVIIGLTVFAFRKKASA